MSSPRARRRVVFRAGMLVLALASLLSFTACIFEKSDYQGGGRSSQGAKSTATATDTTTATTPTPTTTTPSGDSGLLDGG